VFKREGNTKIDITFSVLPGNGSLGFLSIERYEGKMGAVARLKNVLVTNLVEYEKSSGTDYESGDEFADDDNGGSVKVPPSAKAKPKAVPQLEDDSDSPF
jgi:hypothetical protein